MSGGSRSPGAGPEETPWYERAFRGEYLTVYAHRSDEAAAPEAAFAANALGLSAGDRVLDVACGAGRHARSLARLGLRVVGLDLSPDLLRAAAGRGGGVLGFVRADMRSLPCRGGFDASLLFFTSFGYFEEEADDLRVLREIARVLRPGGGLLLDFLNRDRVTATLVPESREERDGVRIVQRRRITADGRRVEKDVRIEREGASPVSYTESVALYGPGEIERMLGEAGFDTEARYGDLAGSPFTADSPRLVSIGRLAC